MKCFIFEVTCLFGCICMQLFSFKLKGHSAMLKPNNFRYIRFPKTGYGNITQVIYNWVGQGQCGFAVKVRHSHTVGF